MLINVLYGFQSVFNEETKRTQTKCDHDISDGAFCASDECCSLRGTQNPVLPWKLHEQQLKITQTSRYKLYLTIR